MVLGVKSIWSSLKFRFCFVKPLPLLYFQKCQCVKFRKRFFRKRFALMFTKIFSRTKQNKHFYKRQIGECTSVESTVVQASIRRLHKRRFDDCTNVDSTIAQASIDGCIRVKSTIVQTSNRRLDKRQIDNCTSIDGSIDYFKKSVKICRCPFSATVLE